ncbi:MAG TPA: protein phosphatase 2C domain-containing protein [Candidatus Competibacter sp.]|nr:protein phosphatase 2C domain-containing protein [Candidatus Competibacter sp.]
MTVTLDSYYTIGKLHLYCEDYVYQGWEPFPYAILADGCSASPNSDIGARLLVLNARRVLPQFALAVGDKARRDALHWRLGRRIVRYAARQVRELGLSPEVLDATLLVAWSDGATVHVHLYGDGCIATRQSDGGVAAIRVEYAENAPYYLSYLLDSERCALYREAVGDPSMVQTVTYLNEAGASARRERCDVPTVFDFSLASFSTVAVATDGLDSFLNVETGERVDLLEIARAVLDFSDCQGAFVKNRLQKMLIEFGKQRLFNLDDIGLSAFVKMA